MDLLFLFKCMMGLYDLDLSYYLVSADSSTCKYNLRHTNYQFKIRYARTINVLKFCYFFRIVSHGTLCLYIEEKLDLKTILRIACNPFYT